MMEAEGRLVGAGGAEGGNGSCLVGTEFQLCEDDDSSGDGQW